MSIKKLNPDVIEPLIERSKRMLNSGQLFWPLAHPHISFICGAAINGGTSLREQFLKHNNSCLPDRRLIPAIAELVVENLIELEPDKPFELSRLEHLIAEVSDSVIIFAESAGSIAELGYFSSSKQIRTKIFLAFAHEHQGPSFISNGPAALCIKDTKYKPGQIVIDKASAITSFTSIHSSINPYMKLKKHRLRIPHTRSFKEHSIKHQLFILREIIFCFSPLSKSDIYFLVEKIFGAYDKDDLIGCISILASLENGITINEDGDFEIKPGLGPLLEYSGDSLRLEVIAFYQKHLPREVDAGMQ